VNFLTKEKLKLTRSCCLVIELFVKKLEMDILVVGFREKVKKLGVVRNPF